MSFVSLAGEVKLRHAPPRLAQLPGWNPGGSPAFIAQEQASPAVAPTPAPASAAPAPAASPTGSGPSLLVLGLGIGAFALATIIAFNCPSR